VSLLSVNGGSIIDRPKPRQIAPRWQIGDLVEDRATGTRWVIRILDEKTGLVELESMNVHNGPSWWTTTLDKIPAKETR